MKIKKILFLIIAFSLLIVFSGCYTSPNSPISSEPTLDTEIEDTSTSPDHNLHITPIPSPTLPDTTEDNIGDATLLPDTQTLTPTPSITEDAEYSFKQFRPEEKIICFTFDDGPHGQTQKIVDKLKGTGDKVTFFVVGNRLEKPAWAAVTKDAIADGHEIGFHSYDHLNSYTELTLDELALQIEKTNSNILKLGGTPINALRPVGGTLDYEEKYGYPCYLWNVDTEDWRVNSNIGKGQIEYDVAVKELADKIVSEASSGCIVLMHDIYSCSVDAFCLAYDMLKAEGYKFITVSEMFGINGKDASGYTFRSTFIAYYLGKRCS